MTSSSATRPAENHADIVHELVVGNVVVVRFGTGHGISRRVAAGNNGDLVNGVTVLAKACENGVTGLVIRGAALVGFGDDAALFLRPHKDFIDTVVKLDVSDELFAVSGGENRGFVQKIGEIRAGEAGSDARHGLEVDVGSHGLVARMDLENLFASLDVGQINVNLTVETARTKQSRVENIRAVSCGP